MIIYLSISLYCIKTLNCLPLGRIDDIHGTLLEQRPYATGDLPCSECKVGYKCRDNLCDLYAKNEIAPAPSSDLNDKQSFDPSNFRKNEPGSPCQ